MLKGFKRQRVPLDGGTFGAWLGYDTRRKVPAEDSSAVYSAVAPYSFGELWHSSLHKQLVPQVTAGVPNAVQAGRGAGVWASFSRTPSGAYVPVEGGGDKLTRLGDGWRYTDTAGLTQETYDSAGVLQRVHFAGGNKLTYGYTSGLLTSIVDDLGHTLTFGYEQPGDTALFPRIRTVTDQSDTVTRFEYDAKGNLAQIGWADDKTKRFVYEDTNLSWALTGVVDEAGARHSTYDYDAQGRATGTRLAQGADSYSTTWLTPPSWIITDTFDANAHVIRDPNGMLAKTITRTFDALGRMQSMTGVQ